MRINTRPTGIEEMLKERPELTDSMLANLAKVVIDWEDNNSADTGEWDLIN